MAAARSVLNSQEEGREEVGVAWQRLRDYVSCGESALSRQKVGQPRRHLQLSEDKPARERGAPAWVGALFVPMSGCRIFSVKDCCCAKPGERGHLVLLRPFPKVCFFVDLFRQRFSFLASPLMSF